MSRPLELTTHPPLSQTVRDGIDINIKHGLYPYLGFNTARHLPGTIQMRAKRFTDAELAAEFEAARCDAMLLQHTEHVWSPLGETWSMEPDNIRSRAQTLLRFASRPHYFEEQE